MVVKLNPFSPFGSVRVPGSKSDLHRLLIMAALCESETEIFGTYISDDIRYTMSCLEALGASFEVYGETVTVRPIKPVASVPRLFAGESGSTLRFLLPVACALYDSVEFDCAPSLRGRPHKPLIDCLEKNGVSFISKNFPLKTKGRLKRGIYTVDGSVSSQYLSGLMMASPITNGGVILPSRLQSKAYADMTLDRLELFTRNGQYTSPGRVVCAGDWTHGALFLTLGALDDRGVMVSGLDQFSCQGDRAIIDYLRMYGAKISYVRDGVFVQRGCVRPISADITQTPDLIGPLCALAATAPGESVITGCGRLRFKESDRLEGACSLVKAFGARARIEGETLFINGGNLKKGEFCGQGDHRMVMAACIPGAVAGAEISGCEAVNKSLPDFFEMLARVGGKCDVVNDR